MIDTFVKMKVEDGKLIPFYKADGVKMRLFLQSLPKDVTIDVFMGYYEGTEKTNAQLAKVHVLIKEISDYTKQPFKEVKAIIKENCGLFRIVSTAPYSKVLKSFEECSKDELGSSIEEAESILDIIYET